MKKTMNLKQFAEASGVTLEPCDKVMWGGQWAYKTAENPDFTYSGYRTENAAYKAWAKHTFGELAAKTLFKLLDK
jgi:hypothetical protein